MNDPVRRADAADLSSRQTAMDIDRHVANLMRQRRKELGITQQMLARTVDLSYQQIQKYETGVNRIGAGRLFCIAQALGVRTSFFFAGLTNGRSLEDKAIAVLRGESSPPLKPAVRRALLFLLDSLD